MPKAKPYGQIALVQTGESPPNHMWVMQTSEKQSSGYGSKERFRYRSTGSGARQITLRMAHGNINDYNIMVGVAAEATSVRIDAVQTPGNSGWMIIRFDRDTNTAFDLLIYVYNTNTQTYDPVYLLEAGETPTLVSSGAEDVKEQDSLLFGGLAVFAGYSPPPVVIGGGS